MCCTGGFASRAGAVGNAGEPGSSPQGKGPGVFCPAHPDPLGPAASCIPTQAVTPGTLTYAAPICAAWDTLIWVCCNPCKPKQNTAIMPGCLLQLDT